MLFRSISMLSYHLPEGVYLYVKENPKQDNSERSIVFLQEMLKLKNVKLISTKEDTFQLIENSKAVATVTGTVAWEAMLRKKPAIIFGKHINRFAPGAFAVRNNIECIKALKIIFKGQGTIDQLFLRKMKIFMLAMESVCFKSRVLSEMPTEGVDLVHDLDFTSCAITKRVESLINAF